MTASAPPQIAVAVAVFVHVAATGIVVAAYIAVVDLLLEQHLLLARLLLLWYLLLLLGKHGVLLLHLRCHWISIRLLLILHHAS